MGYFKLGVACGMRCCLDTDKVKKLIFRHQSELQMLNAISNYHSERIEMLSDYIREIEKPGFKPKNRTIIMSPKPKSDLVVNASNTWQSDYDV